MGQSQNHTIQCVLLLNVLTEKVFIVLWAWYITLAIVTFCNLTSWSFSFLNPRSAEHFIFNHLEMSGKNIFSDEDNNELTGLFCLFSKQLFVLDLQEQVSRFIQRYLKSDGILILRLIAQHANVVFTTDLIYTLWESHYVVERLRVYTFKLILNKKKNFIEP